MLNQLDVEVETGGTTEEKEERTDVGWRDEVQPGQQNILRGSGGVLTEPWEHL